jgi:hypothetical protein
MRSIFFFDLDGTTVNSSHRQGETLDDWRRMNTPENIRLDSTLPLADAMVAAIRAGLNVNILTSRVMGLEDTRWLMFRGMLPTEGTVLSRNHADERTAGTFKLSKLLSYSQKNRIRFDDLRVRSIIFDDDVDVQHTLTQQGFRVIDPASYNEIRELYASEGL